MCKRFAGFTLVVLMALFLTQAAVAAAPQVVLSAQSLIVDSKYVVCEKFNIDGSNYIRLRDIAYLLNGTDSQFSVNRDSAANTVSLVTGEAYLADGSELVTSDTNKSCTAVPCSLSVQIDGETVTDLSAYHIGNSDYFKLRDLGNAMGFAVKYNVAANAAVVNSIAEVTVTTAEELLDAIAPNTKILLSPGTYNLSTVKSADVTNPYVSWDAVYDGAETIISGVKNCTLTGGNASSATVVVEPRYADVLEFRSCAGITVKNLTIGHTTEPGYCMGGVVNLTDSENIVIDSCVLYGCGTYGVVTQNAQGLTVRDTDIKECTYGIMSLSASSSLSFENSRFFDCGGFTMLNLDNCSDVSFSGCAITDNSSAYQWDSLISLSVCNDVTFDGCRISGNSMNSFINVKSCSSVSFTGNTLEDNTFASGLFAEYSDTDIVLPAGVE
ncbi:MAG: right-handed parallel beta-helix repeat-containing protein [Oscillospiraceae bacterium]